MPQHYAAQHTPRSRFRCFALLLVCFVLCASIVTSINDIVEHPLPLSAELLPDAQLLEHLENHDNIIALAEWGAERGQPTKQQRVRAPQATASHPLLLFCSIDHPPESSRV